MALNKDQLPLASVPQWAAAPPGGEKNSIFETKQFAKIVSMYCFVDVP